MVSSMAPGGPSGVSCRTARGPGRRTRGRSAPRVELRRVRCPRRSGGSSPAVGAAGSPPPAGGPVPWRAAPRSAAPCRHRGGRSRAAAGAGPSDRSRRAGRGRPRSRTASQATTRSRSRTPFGRVVGPRGVAGRVQPDHPVELLDPREDRVKRGSSSGTPRTLLKNWTPSAPNSPTACSISPSDASTSPSGRAPAKPANRSGKRRTRSAISSLARRASSAAPAAGPPPPAAGRRARGSARNRRAGPSSGSGRRGR